ncbi:unnamed protein product [Microthlaspi erraticum]|uniref:Uncharacterized protein n=1 Tax=Microthlaspi erraticum TaxID=1685480 RepID=A0A6D2KK71_9BRAS|nr:unnamed protein product [Microthlaspi erraticum]
MYMRSEKEPSNPVGNKKEVIIPPPEKTTHKTPRCYHESSPCRDDSCRTTRSGRIWGIMRGQIAMHLRSVHSRIRRYSRSLPISEGPPDEPPLRNRSTLRRKNKRPLLPSPRRAPAGDALTWFGNLRADSIDSFDDLAAAFLKQHLRFALDDLVFCKTDDDTIYGLGKFGKLRLRVYQLEDNLGPFRIAKVVKPGVYQLEDNLGITDRLWSSSDLRKFHVTNYEWLDPGTGT